MYYWLVVHTCMSPTKFLKETCTHSWTYKVQLFTTFNGEFSKYFCPRGAEGDVSSEERYILVLLDKRKESY